ncbi:polyprenyl synthetase family protein [Streptomyces longwoodensis]|uniref:polyprenyl synthetase family protein n=1 Tax=Streptomyces longwoodensis TaxID=68231 RepID=UPI0033AEDE14
MTVADVAAAPAEVVDRCARLTRPALREAVDRLHPWVGEMAAYSFGWCDVGGAPVTASGGKGLRQALAVLGAEIAGASPEAGVPAAVAVELVHTFSLLHDDVMDGDPVRRGRPAVWRAYGTGPAVLAGDALFALAVDTLATSAGGAGAVRLLSAALGDLVRGQADDLLFAGRPWTGPHRVRSTEYRLMAEGKTGALLGCSLALGALLGGASPAVVAGLDRAGRQAGVAFQIADDVLGTWGDPAVTGKPVHGDLRERKKILPVVSALESDRPAARRLAALLEADGDVARAAELAEEAGGRAAALAVARGCSAAALSELDRIRAPARPVRDLRALLDGVVARTR